LRVKERAHRRNRKCPRIVCLLPSRAGPTEERGKEREELRHPYPEEIEP